MAAKMAVYYKIYKNIFPETGKLHRFNAKCWSYWFLSYRHHPCNIPVTQLMHHSEFDIFKMASRMVANKFYKPMGAAPSL